jgi:hypothetical protein
MEQLQEHFENPVIRGFAITFGIIIGLSLFILYIWDFMYPLTKIGGKKRK